MNNKLYLLTSCALLSINVSASESNSSQILLAMEGDQFTTIVLELSRQPSNVWNAAQLLLSSQAPVNHQKNESKIPLPPSLSQHPILSRPLVQTVLSKNKNSQQRHILEQLLILVYGQLTTATNLKAWCEEEKRTLQSLRELPKKQTKSASSSVKDLRKGKASAYKRLTVLTEEDGE